MEMKAYFETSSGKGVLSTADGEGRVDAAIYAKPHVMDDGTLAFIMRDRLTHKNLTENPYAAYLFVEDGPGYRGIRLFLKKVREDADPELIRKMTRRSLTPEEDEAKGPKFLVYFELEKSLDLIGSGVPAIG
ncbi:pyridoxamine 5'-phosphate oxidase family protein [uncultured Desulfuromonas sp.]|uniref:pyridoxamine 5'-phosphate oxidase family protein n=2 Tax=Desulfuromonas TaxID=890 RepID=UPI00263777C4|nr:pyridoxamine 5'-phosphate oxidase family protein [uncultured Desulfuromonas sp.]